MANISFNNYAVKSAMGNILNFVNEGLKNLGLETKNNIKNAIESLWNGKNNVTMSTFRPIPESIRKFGSFEKKKRDDFDYDTGEPVFKSDEEYVAYSKEYDEAVKHHEETFGVTNWRDYNCLVGFGCKWDSEVELKSYHIDAESGITTIFMDGDTAWDYPYFWLKYIKETFGLNVYICAQEEFDSFNLYGEIDNIDDEFAEKYFNDHEPKRSDYNNVEDYHKAYHQFRVDFSKSLYRKFQECVNGEESNRIND